MVYLYQHKTVDEYLFLVVKFISFNLLDFLPYSVKKEENNRSPFSPFFCNIYQESEKKVFQERHQGWVQWFIHMLHTFFPYKRAFLNWQKVLLFSEETSLQRVKFWSQINMKANTRTSKSWLPDLAQQIYLNKCKTAPYIYTSSAY